VLPLLPAVLLTSVVNRSPRRARRVRELPGSQAPGTGERSASTCEQVPLAYVPRLVLAPVLVVALHRTAQVTLLARHIAWNQPHTTRQAKIVNYETATPRIRARYAHVAPYTAMPTKTLLRLDRYFSSDRQRQDHHRERH
jgi:hypothetical protein